MWEDLRDRLGSMIFTRVAGPDGPEHRERIHHAPGVRRFTPADPISRLHADSAMFVGGIRALLLQSLHPRAMAAVAEHSGYRGDPWGRLNRTANFIAETTYATIEDADRAIRIVRAHHSKVVGVTPEGEAYSANDPELLLWVHCAEIDSFLAANARFGKDRLTAGERDVYVAQTAGTARALGAEKVPESVAELKQTLADFRPDLRATPEARATARFILLHPPVTATMVVPYGMLASAAVSLMPWWTRPALRLPLLPMTETTLVRAAGTVATRTIGWAMQRQ